MAQMLLFPDPRPLVERLGPEFFRSAPQLPGVYLMRDRADTVLYVGKAKNLRKRLASYRVANPDRIPRRHLKMLRAVERIELQPCADELAALAKEAALLRALRPRFNRAGTWPGPARYFSWRITDPWLHLAVTKSAAPDWQNYGPLGGGAIHLRGALARLLWCALHPDGGFAGLPEGWFTGRGNSVSISCQNCGPMSLEEVTAHLRDLLTGHADPFVEWMLASTSSWTRTFDLAARDADLETVTELVKHAKTLLALP
jgi:hypothetical protein